MSFYLFKNEFNINYTYFATDMNKIGYVSKVSDHMLDVNVKYFLSINCSKDLSSIWSILLFTISRLLYGDPNKILGLLKRGHGFNMIFRRNYQSRMSMISSKKNAANIILDHHTRINEKLSNKLLINKPKFKYSKGEISLNANYEIYIEAELLSCIKNNVIVPANH